MGENTPRVVTENFSVGQRAVNRRAHGAEIALANFRIDRRAGEFSVDEFDARCFRHNHHFLQELCADLMAETARAAMDSDDNIVGRKSKRRGDLGIEDFGDDLDFEIVIARTERAHFPPLPFLGTFRDPFGPSPAHLAAFLNARQIAALAPAALDGPTGAAGQHRFHLDGIERDRAVAADAGRNLTEQRFCK